MKEQPQPEKFTKRDVLLAIGGVFAIYFTLKDPRTKGGR